MTVIEKLKKENAKKDALIAAARQEAFEEVCADLQTLSTILMPLAAGYVNQYPLGRNEDLLKQARKLFGKYLSPLAGTFCLACGNEMTESTLGDYRCFSPECSYLPTGSRECPDHLEGHVFVPCDGLPATCTCGKQES